MTKKIISDILHGYIELTDKEIDIINHPLFQRLKRVTQGLNQSAYPSCRYSRFEHSLGVMHIGSLITDNLINNCDDKRLASKLRKFKPIIRLACLLHDIGHTPLSHIGEYFIDKNNLINTLCSLRGASFRQRYENAKSHELLSALIVLQHPDLQSIIKDKVERELIADMIIGNFEPYRKRLEFALVQILYSQIDADKVDYVLRDNLMSGGTFSSLDKNRMILAYVLNEKEKTLRLSYKALSTIGNFVLGRSNIYIWVINHHRNILDSGLHYYYISELINNKLLDKRRYFSYKAITKYHVDDNDIYMLFKEHKAFNDITKLCYEHIFSRGYLSPLWKSGIEFDSKIKNLDASQKTQLIILKDNYNRIHDDGPNCKRIEEHIREELNIKECIFVFKCTDKRYNISSADTSERDSIYILLRDKSEKSYDEIFPESPIKTLPDYFYVYLDRKSNFKNNIVNFLFPPRNNIAS